MQMKPQMKVVVVGRGYKSGKFMATSGILIDKPSKLNCKELKTSTCKITKVRCVFRMVEISSCIKMSN